MAWRRRTPGGGHFRRPGSFENEKGGSGRGKRRVGFPFPETLHEIERRDVRRINSFYYIIIAFYTQEFA